MVEFKKQRYILMTIDPVHIGTGGHRLGRVDNSIVRELGTRVPKIPATSIHGSVRSHSARLYGTPEAAGQNQDKIDDPETNPICYTFGYIKRGQNSSSVKAFSGVVNIFDAHILLFPVHSIKSVVWVTTQERLEEAGFKVQVPSSWDTNKVLTTWDQTDHINLGWLMLEVGDTVTITPPKEIGGNKRWATVANKIIVVSDRLFGHIVNSNLEIRTSVSINPETGAAEERALFTYEAIPRSTFLTMEVVLDNYRVGANFPVKVTHENNKLAFGPWEGPLDVVKAGLRAMEWLGIGGMGTRGFGRIAVVGEPQEIELVDGIEKSGD